jgi:hypothetical protein
MPGTCGCCAFRLGSMPNQCAATVRDALDSLVSPDTDFMCHHALGEAGEPTRKCWGYEAAKLAPFDSFSRHLATALEAMPGEDARDAIREGYVQWLETADPENRLDDYQRAALYAQATQSTKSADKGCGE